ncbi:MAG: hypothetical protein M1381_01050 [Deltaproteobacteria bacterium]|nr:hypothetical protein [Deltaproteobacteria bacterium]MCL5792169.1 hypothetical protein [Deltaproteobacteria bacterium]
MVINNVSMVFIVLEVLAGVFTIVFWILFFFVPGSVQSSDEKCYMVFQKSFVAADLWMSIAFFLSAYFLYRSESIGVLWGIVAGGTFVFLGLMDVLYNIENGMYKHINSGMFFEILINLTSLVFGSFTINYVWYLIKH